MESPPDSGKYVRTLISSYYGPDNLRLSVVQFAATAIPATRAPASSTAQWHRRAWRQMRRPSSILAGRWRKCWWDARTLAQNLRHGLAWAIDDGRECGRWGHGVDMRVSLRRVVCWCVSAVHRGCRPAGRGQVVYWGRAVAEGFARRRRTTVQADTCGWREWSRETVNSRRRNRRACGSLMAATTLVELVRCLVGREPRARQGRSVTNERKSIILIRGTTYDLGSAGRGSVQK